ncbi:MAG: helix-turn-helix transcriptional regulator [Bacteroidetes bacterium]|nr:helix-turn-helix transcriptional regulator [Bacteroidota bacterium]
MIERLLELMRMKNLSSSQLADAIKVQRSGISHFVSGRNKPSLEFILRILNYFPDLNPDWLLFGKDPVFRNPVSDFNKIAIPDKQKGSDSIFLNEKIPDTQPLFLDELFPLPSNKEKSELKESDQRIKEQSIKQRISQGQETGTLKKETSGNESSTPDAFKDESPERIVIFYKNKTFREFLPE